MSDPIDLTESLRKQRVLLIDCVAAMKESGRKLANAEYHYKVSLRQEILRLHVEDGVAWTSCYTLAQGQEEVAKMRFTRDVHKSDYEVLQEKINACKLEIRLLEGEIKRDWQG